eukprot:257376_1
MATLSTELQHLEMEIKSNERAGAVLAGASTQTNASDALLCMCGNEMDEVTVSHWRGDKHWCDICGFAITSLPKDTKAYTCSRGGRLPHCGGYDNCHECASQIKQLNKNPIKETYSIKSLYFIYNDHKICGPYDIDQIIMLYVKRRLKSNKLYIKSAAAEDGDWQKIQLAHNMYARVSDKDQIRMNTIKDCLKANEQIKVLYPELYTNLIENTINGTLRQVDVPTTVPTDAQRSSFYVRLMHLLGAILAYIMVFFLVVHNLPSLIFGCCIVAICACVLSSDHQEKIVMFGLLMCYSGMLYSPAIIVFSVLSSTDTWNEIQSWMISYIIWGITSFLFTISYLFGVFLYKRNVLKLLDNVILLIIGINFGEFDVMSLLDGGDSTITIMFMMFVLPSFASLFPSAVIGFLANFVLEEKFVLECGDNVSEEYLCFDDEYGCCEVISSHDYRDTYGFVGGLASNVIAAWAVIRVVGYLVINAFPSIAAYATRK